MNEERRGVYSARFFSLVQLRLNVHFHTFALDGAIVRDEEGELLFRELDAPTTEDVTQVAVCANNVVLWCDS